VSFFEGGKFFVMALFAGDVFFQVCDVFGEWCEDVPFVFCEEILAFGVGYLTFLKKYFFEGWVGSGFFMEFV
jgi:hypothetical protein